MLIVFLLWIALSAVVGMIGRDRKLGFLGFFLLSFAISPLLVFIVLMVTIPETSESG